jgi:putative membrane protein
MFSVASCPREGDRANLTRRWAKIVMTSLLAAMRRLFPPLEIRWKLLCAIAFLGVYGLFVGWIVRFENLPRIEWGAESTVLDGLVLGFLIAFRNHQAYDRWWEARKLWGQLVNESRNLCLKVRVLPGISPADRERIGSVVIGFAEALKHHLRRRDCSDKTPARAGNEQNPPHEPVRLAGTVFEMMAQWQHDGHLDGWTLLWLNGQVKSLMDICGACEKIRYTPLASSYRALLRQGIALYLIVSPFYLIEDTGLIGFPLFILAAYFLLGIELVAEEIEEPFGAGGDNLPLESYCTTIEASVREILGPGSEHMPAFASGLETA